jgi:flagellar hook-associated protein FlgK
MNAYSIGLSALRVNQRLMDLTGQNIANAQTPGYHRQIGLLATQTSGNEVGGGVQITRSFQFRSSLLESAMVQNTTEERGVASQLELMRQVEQFLTPGEGSVHNLLDRLFNQFEQVAGNPGDGAQRRTVLGTASNLANGFQQLVANLDQTRSGVDLQLAQQVKDVNTITQQIADLNAAITQATVRRLNPNDLLDQRDQLLARLAQNVNVRVLEQDASQITILAGGAPLVVGQQATQLAFGIGDTNQAEVTVAGTNTVLNITGGQMGGLLEVRNTTLPGLRGQLDELVGQLVRKLDKAQATGLGVAGPPSLLQGHRAASSTSVPLAQADLAFPVQAGALFLGVTNTASGARAVSQINFDPATQSLQDLATAINGVPNTQAIVDGQSRTLRILAAGGHGIDFTNRLSTSPASSALTGTATPAFRGSYTGGANDAYTFTVVGSGTVGVTPALALEVRDSASNLLTTLNVGQGYESGSTLAVANGVELQLGAGTLNSGETFSAAVVADADTTGLLTALGLNTFFTGTDASNLAVRTELAADPRGLATGTTGLSGDGSNLSRMAALGDLPLLEGGTLTFREYYANLTSTLGLHVQDLDQRQTAKQVLGDHLAAQRESVSGVDANEELVRLVEFQRAFQMSARYISTVDETLSDLLQII